MPAVLFAAILCVGLWLRLAHLDAQPLWADEAETAINALTILQHGVPVDHYQGLPIFENTLIQPWPGNPEYEFKDLSYSKRGLAIYHGWLPLYATAASFRLFGVRPCGEGCASEWRLSDWRSRTRIARFPSIVFGMALLPLLFVAGRRIGGSVTGWSAMLFGSLFGPAIAHSRQARYYSATVLLSLLCAVLLCRFVDNRRWRDAVLGGLALAALFHTHLLSFALFACFYGAATGWVLWRQFTVLPRLCAMWLIAAALTVPWVLATGFLEQAVSIPSARNYLLFPQDVLTYAWLKVLYTLLGAAGAVGLALLTKKGLGYPARQRIQFQGIAFWYCLILIWIVTAHAIFLLGIPLASFFYERLTMLLLPGCILALALLLTATARFLSERHSGTLSASLTFLLVAVVPGIPYPRMEWFKWDALQALQPLQHLAANPQTRFYATPSDHLVLSFYTNLPVQSVAPVRKSFLNGYPHTVVILERHQLEVDDRSPIGWPQLYRRAAGSGVRLSEMEARELSQKLAARALSKSLAERGTRAVDVPGAIPRFAGAALREYELFAIKSSQRQLERAQQSPIFRGFAMGEWEEWWPVFFYRFVEPDARRGEHLNYLLRIHSADIRLFGGYWIGYVSPTPADSSKDDTRNRHLRSFLLRD
ncbi:MAG: hypothetical protein JNK87_08255 [Bryobacterales bacterium]|nr:hypothetical protein [Bryobacterales bacterium]